MVYLTTQDWPTIYKLSLEDPLAARRASRAASGEQGRTIYEDRCQACHGVNGAGSPGGPPALAGANRIGFDAFRRVVVAGKGEMPAFTDLEDIPLNALYAFLGGGNTSNRSTDASVIEPHPASGPIVASGGAPGGLRVEPPAARYSPLGGPDILWESRPRPIRYYTDWGLYPDQPSLSVPPWSAIVAFDLNRGTIKWRVPLGEDARAVKEGAKAAGVFMAERHGMIAG